MSRLVPVLLASLLPSACGGTDGTLPPGDEGPLDGGTVGLFTLLRDGDARDAGVSVGGQFVRVPSLARLRVVRALDPTLAALPWDVEEGRCRPAGRAVADPEAADPGDYRMELLDAGVLVGWTPGGRASMLPRAFPEILPELSGVVYGTDEAEALPWVPEAEYALSGGGGEDVGPFEVVVPAPRDLDPDDLVLLPLARGGLEVVWGEGDPDADPAHVELARSGRTLSCSVPDTGRFRLPPAALAELPEAGEARLTVRRVRTQAFSAPGAPRGDAVFVVKARRDVMLPRP